MAKKLFIKTYGCQMNVYDSARMTDVLAPLGYGPTDDPTDADMVILNTCHIREKASEKTFSEIGRLRLEQAREAVASLPPSVTAYAFAYDGFITVQGTKFDAILVEASERGRPAGVRMAQRYTPKAGSRDFQAIGNPALLGECEGMLR